ncbi:MAG: HAD-IA family hydrolase [Clostridia bacterium]|nr:HAD-IA family hydrolase [Clostridia bacterium]
MGTTKAVIFDMDGTILDTLGDLVSSVNYALTQHGYPSRTVKEIRSFLGNGPANLIWRSCPAGTSQQTAAQVLTDTYLPYYAAHCRDTTAPYPGIQALLDTLRQAGIRMAVVSNKQECDVEALRQQFFADTVSLAVGDVAGRPLKPAPDGVLLAMERLGVTPEETWFVGDSEVDVLTARNAGLRCIAVTWGFRDAPELVAAGADILADTPQQAAEYILGKRTGVDGNG